MRIRYLNTDLDLVARSDLAVLTEDLRARGVRPLYTPELANDGNWYCTLEIDAPVGADDDEPEDTIAVMLDALESLAGPSKQLWTECTKREFNIGYDCGSEPWAFNHGFSNGTLRRIAELGASVRITLYPPPVNKPT